MFDYLRILGNPFAGDAAGTVIVMLAVLTVAVARWI